MTMPTCIVIQDASRGPVTRITMYKVKNACWPTDNDFGEPFLSIVVMRNPVLHVVTTRSGNSFRVIEHHGRLRGSRAGLPAWGHRGARSCQAKAGGRGING